MTLQELLELIPMLQLKDATWILWWIFVIVASLIQIAPLKLNPWDIFLGAIGKRLNKAINDRMKVLEKKQKDFETKFDDYVREQNKRDLDEKRSLILQFCHECMLHIQHTQEQFKFVLRLCDEYEKYIEDNRLKNGEISDAIDHIRNIHKKCIAENSFLVTDEQDDT